MKEPCTRDEYWSSIAGAGGLDRLRVLSSYTFFDDPRCPFGPGRHLLTEWGDASGDFVCEHEEHNGHHTYRRAVES